MISITTVYKNKANHVGKAISSCLSSLARTSCKNLAYC